MKQEDRIWVILIKDTGSEVSATVINIQSGNALILEPISYDPNNPGKWDEAVADLFAGPLPNIRDSFDTVE